MNLTKANKYPDWTIDDLNKAIKSLKSSQSQDTMGVVNELFMIQNIGSDLKLSILQIFNIIKKTNHIPEFFKHVYVTAIPKKRKAALNLTSEHGICLVLNYAHYS